MKQHQTISDDESRVTECVRLNNRANQRNGLTDGVTISYNKSVNEQY